MSDTQFTLSKNKYEEQLKIQEEQQSTISAEQMLDKLTQMDDFMTSFADQSYRVQFESREEFLEGQKVMSSDDALVQYYEKNDPKMLTGLKSKSFINIAGKKSEKKKLRKSFLEAHTDRYREIEGAKAFAKEDTLEQKKSGFHDTFYNTVDEAAQALKKKETEEIMRYYYTQHKEMGELNALEEKVGKLNYTKRQQLLKMTRKMMIDNDLAGVDTEEVKKAQDKYIKTRDPNVGWEGYRLYRSAREFDKNHSAPDDTDKRVKEAKIHSTGEFKERTINAFMKEVKYAMKDGKKVPASPQDAENLQFNKKWVDSICSDNEDDWDFRFESMQKDFDQAWAKYSPYIKDFFDGKFDLEKTDVDMMEIYSTAKKFLCFSGVSSEEERTDFFKSKRFKSLPKEKQNEYDLKNDLMNNILFNFQYKASLKGLDFNGFRLPAESGYSQVPDMLRLNNMLLKSRENDARGIL